MDKSWIREDRDSLQYEIGVENFLIFAEGNAKNPKKIPCPCGRCVNFKKLPVKTIRGHLYEHGFSLGYVEWIWHGEESSKGSKSSVGTSPALKQTNTSETNEIYETAYNDGDYDNESFEFKRFVADAEQPLFEGSDFTKLESMLKLHNWKARFGISDSAFTDLLGSVGSILPKDHVGAYSEATECPNCNLSRWKIAKDGRVRVNIPAKVMWYFPIIPRFKRLFKSESTAKLMTWHESNRIEDGLMRHPADSPSWRNIDFRWPEFGAEARNLRLALAADGINPFNNGLTNRYTCWPVVLVTYNVPPWLCMKRFMMLTVLVPGPHEPGNNIDVYLQPMIDDLKKLWEEDEPNVYDAFTKFYFTLKAVLLWTVNDFPAYGNLSGSVNKGYKCCPICGDDTRAKYLSHSRKMSYQGHRRYLGRHHPYRKQKAAFDGEQEFGHAPIPLSGEEVLKQQEKLNFRFGKEKKSNKVESVWKKKSIFFELEYWKFHHVRHCLDVMHIEKNVCDSLIGTLLNLKFKSKDSTKSRLDMVHMGIRADLAPEIGEKKTYLPPASYTLSKAEKKIMLSSLSNMKRPYGHASNIKNCVSLPELKVYGMKSHDCHTLLQQLLPVAIRSVLPKNVRETGVSVKIPCDRQVFGCDKKICLLQEELLALLQFNMVGQSAISAYMMNLYNDLCEAKELDTFGFFNPGLTYNINEDFKSYVVKRLREGRDRIYFIPHNTNQHWILAIIWDGEIYILNSLSHPTQFPKLEKALIE
nr:PREDICTED: uncharacterized protein LOC108207178 [Daucus carota subsp. sativus]